MYVINQKRINSINFLKEFNIEKIQIGIPVIKDEDKKVGLKTVGDVILPSAEFGIQCRKNAYGYAFADKSAPKEYRYVSTNYIHPYGNKNADSIPVDMSRKCYPKVEVLPYEIRLMLIKNKEEDKFIIVEINSEIRESYLKEAINILLEIYGICYIYDDGIKIYDGIIRKTCDWEILPPGENPSDHMRRYIANSNIDKYKYDIYRITTLENNKPKEMIAGINGFRGYYAFLFENYCILETAIYGNATYVINKDKWKILSKKTKKELFDENEVIEKIVHTAKWEKRIKKYI